MEKSEVIKAIKQYFSIKELVDPYTYNKFGETSWQFLQKDFLEVVLVIREEILKQPMLCNSWARGGKYSQRGFRSNICEIPKMKTFNEQLYNSAHCLGCGADFTLAGMSADEARTLILRQGDILPVNIRMENDVDWLHIDTFDPGREEKVYVFKV